MMLLALLLGCPETGKPRDDTAPTSTADCTGFGLDVPSPRGEVAGIWDPLNRRFLVFGGDEGVPVECSSQTSFSDELWAFYPDCDAWEQVDASGPGPRGRHVAAYDPAGERMIVYGEKEHLIVTIGMQDTIVVHTPNATLVAPKHEEERVREVVRQLQARGWKQYL